MCLNNGIALGENLREGLRSISRPIILTIMLSLMSSCTLLQTDGERSEQLLEVDNNIIAKNLIFTLAQVSQLHPLRTTLQVVPAQGTGFEAYAQARLSDAGYTLRTQPQALGIKPVRISTTTSELFGDRYSISIGAVTIARSYALDAEGFTIPASTLVLKGARTQPVSLDESLFTGQFDQGYSQVIFVSPPQNIAASADTNVVLDSESEAANTVLESESIVRHTMYETLQSNYAGLLDDFQDVLIFPNDSLRSGNVNKDTIASYEKAMRKSDMISVVGCSHGKSALQNANQVLGLGRANRVKEALILAGVMHDQILEEGCWASDDFGGVMPARGVLLSFKETCIAAM